MTKTDLIEAALQPCVFCAVKRMYNRYLRAAIKSNDKHTASFFDFTNQLFVRGLYECDKDLAKDEKKLGIT